MDGNTVEICEISELVRCTEVCFVESLVYVRRPGDFDGGCHWWHFSLVLIERNFVWIRKNGGEKAIGNECGYWGMPPHELKKYGYI